MDILPGGITGLYTQSSLRFELELEVVPTLVL